ncbi:MAG: ATP-binding protein [Pleomorphochaeta sp.]
MEIKRDLYLDKLKSSEHNGLIKVITGVRRAGKSYILFNLFSKYLIAKGIKDENIIKIQLDNIKFIDLRDPKLLYKYITSKIINDDLHYILIDEIQFVENFTDLLNGLLYINNVDIYVTGSNSKFLSSDVITEFRGRGDEIRIFPLSFSEFFSVYNGTFEEAFDEYMIYGGLPRIISMESDEKKSQYLKNLFRETYLVDIVERNKIRNTSNLEEIVNIISSSIGSLTNPKKLENTFKSVKKSTITDDTIKSYLEALKESFLIDAAMQYDVKGKKYINSPMKYYFVDVGLRNARLNFRQIEETHLMENIIYNQLKVRSFNVDIGVVKIRELNTKNKLLRKKLEIDFIASKGIKKYYIQSAYSLPSEEKKEQEKRPFRNINDSFKKIIILGKVIKPRIDESGIMIIGIKDFLLKEDIFDF